MGNTSEISISCLLPVYAGDDLSLLRRAISSITEQTVSVDQLLILVDGPIPNEMRHHIIETSNYYSYIDILESEINIGLAKMLSYGVLAAKYNYVMRMDADDFSLRERVRKTKQVLHEQEFDLIHSSAIINTGGRKITKVLSASRQTLSSLKYGNSIIHPSVTFKRSFAITCGNYANVKNFEDYDLWLRFYLNKATVKYIDEPLIEYNADNNLSTRRLGWKYAKSELNFISRSIIMKTLPVYVLPLFTIRILVRLLPKFIVKHYYNKFKY